MLSYRRQWDQSIKAINDTCRSPSCALGAGSWAVCAWNRRLGRQPSEAEYSTRRRIWLPEKWRTRTPDPKSHLTISKHKYKINSVHFKGFNINPINKKIKWIVKRFKSCSTDLRKRSVCHLANSIKSIIRKQSETNWSRREFTDGLSFSLCHRSTSSSIVNSVEYINPKWLKPAGDESTTQQCYLTHSHKEKRRRRRRNLWKGIEKIQGEEGKTTKYKIRW